MEQTDKYSVLMSVYKKERSEFFRQSIDSLLCQTVPPADFVLVCDGQLTAELDATISAYENNFPALFNVVRLSENQGLAHALDCGLAHCRYEIVARMDSDDIAKPYRCEKQLQAMRENDADIVGGAIMEFAEQLGDGEGIRRTPESHDEILRFARRRNPFNHPCVMCRKGAVLAVGGYQPKDGQAFPFCEDYYLWVRMLRDGSIGYNIPEILLYMRTGNGMYKRRSGTYYLFTILRFKNHIRKIGFSSWKDFWVCVLAHIALCLISNGMRKAAYDKYLRKNNHGRK